MTRGERGQVRAPHPDRAVLRRGREEVDAARIARIGGGGGPCAVVRPAAAAHLERADVRHGRAVRAPRDDDPLVRGGHARIIDAVPQEHRAVRPAARHPSPAPAPVGRRARVVVVVVAGLQPRHSRDLRVVRSSHGADDARGGGIVDGDGGVGAVRDESAAGAALAVPRRRVDRAVAPRADVLELRAGHD